MVSYCDDTNIESWYAVYAKLWQKERAREQLVNQGVKVLLPTISTHSGKKLKSPNLEIFFLVIYLLKQI